MMISRLADTALQVSLAGALVLLLTGCAVVGESSNAGPPPEPCAVVEELLASHVSGFVNLRGAQSENRYADVWLATRRAIGGHCEIWDSGRAQYIYLCTRSAPSADAADQYFDSARSTVRACLDESWSESAGPRKDGRGEFVRFSDAAAATELTIQKVRSEGVLRGQWTVYYAIGDPARLRE